MNIDNYTLLNLYKAKNTENLQENNNVQNSNVSESSATALNSNGAADAVIIGGKDVTLSDVSVYSYMKVMNDGPVKVTTSKINTEDLSKAEQSHIKQLIYNLHHKTSGGGSGGGGGSTGGGEIEGGGGETGGGSTGGGSIDPNKKSFLNEFNDVDSMFDYISTIDSSINKNGGITRTQLINLTRDDDWEESHYEFFGQLNYIFNILDTDGNNTLSAEELKSFIGDELGTSASTFTNKVETYAQQIQREYASFVTDKAKLDFLLKLTKEYFEAAGLTYQLESLERLIASDSIFIELFDDPNNLGQYRAGQGINNATGEEVLVETGYAPDGTGKQIRLGMAVNKSMIDNPNTKWYELVEVLVHEITHATKINYFNNGSNIAEASTKGGECVAYQTDEDFQDSIGKGSWKGALERQSILDHLKASGYDITTDGAKEPNWKWWSYA